MSQSALGIMIGGLLPAILFSFSALFNKLALQSGMGASALMCLATVAGFLVALIWMFIFGDSTVTLRGAGWSMLLGASWTLGILLISYAIHYFGSPMSQLVPLYNMNTLFAVLLSLWVFAEWKQVHIPQVLIGSVCIVLGGILVSRA